MRRTGGILKNDVMVLVKSAGHRCNKTEISPQKNAKRACTDHGTEVTTNACAIASAFVSIAVIWVKGKRYTDSNWKTLDPKTWFHQSLRLRPEDNRSVENCGKVTTFFSES